MLKIIGLTLLFCAVASAGVLAGAGLRERVRCLTEFQKIVAQFGIYTQYAHTDIFETMRRIHANEKSELLGRLLALQSDWNRASVDAAIMAENSADREIMLDFFTSIGTTDLSGQAAVCAQAAGRVSAQLAQAKEEWNNKGKMYRSLGLCAGLAAVIFFV